METLRELMRFILSRKKYWLLPLIFVVLVLGALIVLSGNSVLAPFIYTLF